ncbi:hypothetical protein PAXRUDRAFT_824641 [Paxillus rubicundulus Ve08.2h10]|uniref:Glutaredoxin domain-containing protein n=1 Tax=Paxillus rubicundulus Ve08.2h10 TaxID=930991 RepID=A0A0D0E1J4_9AGAM|nr:hypothetical protein PAXRUDRAFT_824641 [Paxillus rubicundulus Ve08.2h10]
MLVFSHIHRSLPPVIKLVQARAPTNFLSNSAPSSSSLSPRHALPMAVCPQEFVDDKIKSHKIVVFSKTHCPYCKATKNYFASNYPAETVEVVELDTRDDGSHIQDYLSQITGARSVPRTFINGKSIGGNSDLQGMPAKDVSKWIEGA